MNTSITAAQARATDRQTRAHLADAKDQIAKALDPKFAAPAPTTPANPFGIDFEDDMRFKVSSFEDFNEADCWPDYAIRLRPQDHD